MARDLRNRIRKCGRCKKFKAAPPVAPLRPLACSGPGELLHVDFTSIEETVPLHKEPVIRNVMVMQDHFSKYVVTYVVKDQMAHTVTETLRNGYFGLFGEPAYLVSDQGKAFTGHLISNLCELYGVQKLRTLPYHAQTNGQVERMNQTIIRMICKLEQDKKARWSEHMPEMLAAYNGTHLAVTGYSPYFLLFGRKSRMPVDCLFPTLHDSPHQAKMEVSVAAMQKSTRENDLMELEAPKVLWRLRNLGVNDVLRGLHSQEQSWYPRERNHLTTHLDLHKDDLGLSGLIACLGLRGNLEVEVGFAPGGGLDVGSFIHEAQSHHGGVGII